MSEKKSERTKLNAISRKAMICGAYRKAKEKEKRLPLWCFVRDVCGVGKTTAIEICKECDWDADWTNLIFLPYGQ